MKPDSLGSLSSPSADIVICRTPGTAMQAELPLSDQVSSFITQLFDTKDWPPRWYCGNWSDFHGWLYILSDIGIWAAYFAIPVLLLLVLKKRTDVPFHGVFKLFIAFILLCGLTHLLDAAIFWWPAYRLSALVRLATAVVSIFTVHALYKTLPLIFNLRSRRELEAEIEKRKVLEEKLAASEFLLQEAGRTSGVGGWETDLQTGKRTWSRTVYQILEMPAGSKIDEYDIFDFVQESFRDDARAAIREAIDHGTGWDKELIVSTIRGKSVWVRSTGRPLFDENKKVIKLRGIFMNIDRYKHTEMALNKSLELVTQNNEQLKSFTHILSHNIRNHASNMLLLSTLVDLEKIDEENAVIFSKMKDVSSGLNATLEDLSKAIKIKESAVQKERVFLHAISEKVLSIFEPDLQMIQAKVDLRFDVVSVNFPRIYLESILTNLISNAIKYRDPQRLLRIGLSTYKNEHKQTVLECTDNGLGIDLTLHGNKIFGLYKTFHERKDAHGVGLFLTKTQIESQGGEIRVESEPGAGATFKIIFNE